MRATSQRMKRRPNTKPTAVLDLSKPGELSAHEWLMRSTTGRNPLFRALDIRRKGRSLLVCVETVNASYLVLRLSLTSQQVTWRYFISYPDACKCFRG
jgi:hypothetical protein